MVVVAIIGILASISIPNYQKYQSRARQTEAKISLSAIYTSEVSYSTDSGSFSTCLVDIGFQASGNNRYYIAGFTTTNGTNTTCGPAGGVVCNNTFPLGAVPLACSGGSTSGSGTNNWSATVRTNGSIAVAAETNMQNTDITQNTFVAGAAGNVSTTTTNYDTWTIDNTRKLTNVLVGL
jgi:type IV pilus assembly protein PilA